MDGDASFADVSQHLRQCHVRHPLRERVLTEGKANSLTRHVCHMMEQGRSRFAERHSLLAAGGVMHVRASRSILRHVALRTSIVRQAVRIRVPLCG